MKGYVKKIIDGKRFGFIKAEDGKEYFFYQTDFNGFFDDLVKDSETKQISVKFDVAPSDRGPRASGVTRLDDGIVMD